MHGDLTETVEPDDDQPAIGILEAGTVVASRYQIEDLIGSGGFSRVYAALDLELGERVAIKILRSDRVSPATLSRLRREVKLTREIPRATLVRVYDLGQDRENTFLTMELVRGETLRDRIARGPLPVDETVRIATQVLDALGGLHAAGVVHRDVKPANILLTPDGGAKLADFGLARLWESGDKVTRTEAFVGTLEYVAPEQAVGGRIDGRTDLYSFGVLLYEMLAGRLPHEGMTNIGKVVAHLTTAAPDVRTQAPLVPAWLAELIQKLMEKVPDDRPATAEEALFAMRSQKRDLRWRLRRSRAGASLLTILVAAAILSGTWAWRWYWGSFERIEKTGSIGLRAIDRKGRILWSNPTMTPGVSAALVRVDGRVPILAGLTGGAVADVTLDEIHRLRMFEPRTGEVIRESSLNHAAAAFALEPTFTPGGIAAVDPDHDGREDLVVTYTHSPFWPSYSVYVDPRTGESSAILIASGHHRLAGTADVDDDGVDELLFIGENNRMGRFAGVAAVNVMRATEEDRGVAAWAQASTPDAEYTRGARGVLAWYSLNPRLSSYACTMTARDNAARRLRFACGTESTIEVDYDGFSPASVSQLGRSERRDARERAYRELRDALRAGATERFDDAMRGIRAAYDMSDAAADPILSEWVETNEAILLVRARRPLEAEATFSRILDSTDSPWQVCLQAGRAFESVGELERAARFLELGISSTSASVWDRPELTGLLESIVLVFAQQGRWGDARAMNAKVREAYPEAAFPVAVFETFVDWRTGSPTDRGVELSASVPGVYGYWVFEARWALGSVDAAAFLAEMNAFRRKRPEPEYLYDSLESEVLARLGRADEAKSLARRALAETRVAAESEMIARAHLSVVVERAARLDVR